jgi:signal transduction histidine kinase
LGEGSQLLSLSAPGDSKREDPEPPRLHFVVRDTGMGIPADKISRLFKSFSQADSEIFRLYGGTGLGLAISRRLARLLGGDVTVESRVGVGSTFTVTLPIRYEVDSSAPES